MNVIEQELSEHQAIQQRMILLAKKNVGKQKRITKRNQRGYEKPFY